MLDRDAIAQLLGFAFEQWTASAKPASCEREGDPPAKACRDCVRGSYFEGSPSYECDRFRWMYVCAYLPTNAFAMYDLLSCNSQEVREYLLADACPATLNVVSAGCGPGSDFLGLSGWVEDLRASGKYAGSVAFHGLDRRTEWWPVIKEVASKYGRYPKEPGDTRLVVQRALNDPGDFRATEDDHLFLMSRVWSELRLSIADAAMFLHRLLDASPSLRVLAIVDRMDDLTTSSFERSIENCSRLTVIDRAPCKEHCRVSVPQHVFDQAETEVKCNHSRWLIGVDRK